MIDMDCSPMIKNLIKILFIKLPIYLLYLRLIWFFYMVIIIIMDIGSIIFDKYILIERIGEGHFSEVWMCYNFISKKYYAIKIFDHTQFEVFGKENDILKKIKNEDCRNCVSYIDSFKCSKYACIVQELMVGSLYDIMKKQYPNGFSSDFIKYAIEELSNALNDIHTKLKIVHADIKPENILLSGLTIHMETIISKINTELSNPKKSKLNIKYVSKLIKRVMKTLNETDTNDAYNMIDECESNEMEETDDVSDIDSINTDSDIISSHNDMIDRSYIETDIEMDEHDDVFNIETVVSEKYINEPHIFLSDFGNFINIDDLNGHGDIQTRHYRSPKIILRLELDTRIDIWALGCTIYELYTGKVLFNPHKTGCDTTDIVQLHEIQSILGLFPQKFYDSRKKYIFFNNKYLLQNKKRINYIGFDNKIKKDLCDHEKYDEKIAKIVKNMLKYD